MRVFTSRKEAENAGLVMDSNGRHAYKRGRPLVHAGIVRSDLEAQLAEALAAVESRGQDRHGNRACPKCGVSMDYGSAREHRGDCKLSLALAAFRGEPTP